MPKLQRNEQDEKSAVLLGIIRKYQEISGMSNKRFAERLGVSTSTLYSKLQKPNRLTWDDMFEMFKILKVPPDEAAECFPGKARDVTVKVVMTDLGGRRVASVYQ